MRRLPGDIEDELLVLRCQAGDAKAFGDLVSRWHPRLRGLAARLTSDHEAAGDLAQDAWLAIVHGLRGLDDPAQFRVWAFRIVANKCADWIRRRQVRRDAAKELQAAGGDADRVTPQPALPRADELDPLQTALRQLPDDQRAILALHYLEGLGVSQMAEVFDVPVGTIKSRLHSARARLKNALLEIDHERLGRENHPGPA